MTANRDRSAFGNRLRAARKHAGMTQVELARASGMSQGALADAEKSGNGSTYTAQLARATGVNVHWLASGDGEMLLSEAVPLVPIPVDLAKLRPIFVVGKGSGGYMPARIWTDGDGPAGATDLFGDLASADPHAFLVEIEGASMVPRYNPGEFALVEPGTEPELEDDVLVRLDSGETMIKRLLSRRAGYRFGSYNTAEVLHFAESDVTWVYYVAHPVPRRKIKTRW